MKPLGLVVALLAAAGVARADGVNWETDYAKGVKAAKESGKLLQVHFSADW